MEGEFREERLRRDARGRGRPLFPGWGWARNDVAQYQRLAQLLGPKLRPVRPTGPKPAHVPGQVAFWAGRPPAREPEEVYTSGDGRR
jgi:hypothetical protein